MKKTDLQLIVNCLKQNIDRFGDYLEDFKEIDRGEADFIIEEFMEMIDGQEEELATESTEELSDLDIFSGPPVPSLADKFEHPGVWEGAPWKDRDTGNIYVLSHFNDNDVFIYTGITGYYIPMHIEKFLKGFIYINNLKKIPVCWGGDKIDGMEAASIDAEEELLP
ncbi:MAG: hypothetical protein KAV87_20935 [Desulfobacteraceae bacterium]|nr:hypothetical protein [Desulfobacteraceae bacterium]